MQLRHLWPTPIAQDMLVLPEDMRIGLINVLLRKEADREKIRDTSPDFHRFMTSKKFYASTHYNLFAEAGDHPERDAILAFQNMALGLLRNYLKDAYQIPEEQTVEVSGRCFGNVQSSGARTFPHYHQACDVVMIHYLDVGHGADADVREFSIHIADQALTGTEPPVTVAAIGKGAIPQPRIMKAAITQGVPAAAAMTAFGFMDWVSAHPWASIGLAAVGLCAVATTAYRLEQWLRASREAPTPGLVPVTLHIEEDPK